MQVLHYPMALQGRGELHLPLACKPSITKPQGQSGCLEGELRLRQHAATVLKLANHMLQQADKLLKEEKRGKAAVCTILSQDARSTAPAGSAAVPETELTTSFGR